MKKRIIASLLFSTLLLLIFLPNYKAYAKLNKTIHTSSLQRPIVDNQGTLTKSNLETPKFSKIYFSEWNQYATYYYYNQMNDTQKAFYDTLNCICNYYMEGTKNTATVPLNDGTTLNTISYIKASGLTLADAIHVVQVFYYSNPQYYFLMPYFPYGTLDTNAYVSIGVYPAFANGGKRATSTAAMKAKINAYVSKINAKHTILEKEKLAHDLIVDSVVYEENEFDQSAYSAFLTGKTVCAGYAGAFSILCNAANIDTAVVTSPTHAFNYIRLNDSWYYVDCTWDDLDGAYQMNHMYLFFNRNKDKMKSLLPGQASDHAEDTLWNNYLPVCTLDSGATQTSIGRLVTPSKQTAAPSISIRNTNGRATLTLASTTSGAILYYTLDGSLPSVANSKCYRYTKPVVIPGSATIRAIAVHNTLKDSTVITKSNATEAKRPITKCNVSGLKGKTYNGKPQTQSLVIKWGQTKLASGKDYTLSYKNNKEIGSATITLTGKGNYNGSRSYTFTISPKNAAFKKVTAKKGALRLYWNKDASVSGYQIQYSTSKNFSNKKSITVGKAKTTSYTINRLKHKKKYYIRIRCYKKKSGKTYYGGYSRTLSSKVR